MSDRNLVTLESIARQLDRALAEVTGMRSEVRAQIAVANRIEMRMDRTLNILADMLEQMRDSPISPTKL